MTSARRARHTTIADWLSQPEEMRYELIDGDLVQKAAPDFAHANTQASLVGRLRPPFHRRRGGSEPGGWWIVTEVDIQLDKDGYRPDIAGWRRERLVEMPKTRPVTLQPDWICEIVSESNATTDTIRKLRSYHRAGVPHYWLVDPRIQALLVYRFAPEGYQSVLVAEAGETVRAEPFEQIELCIAELFGDEPEFL